MTQNESRPARTIPDSKSREEEAEWFDTHDLADYQDEFKTVKVRFAKNLSEGLNIRLDKATLTVLREIAHKKGIGPSTLVRMWVTEQLRKETLTEDELARAKRGLDQIRRGEYVTLDDLKRKLGR